MSKPFDVAAAVAAELNAGSGSGFRATTKLVPVSELKDLDVLTITVVPATAVTERLTRTAKTTDVTVDIGVQQKVAGTSPDECKGPADACEVVLDFLWGRALSTMSAAHFVSASIDPVCDHELLQKLLVFSSVVKVTYRV